MEKKEIKQLRYKSEIESELESLTLKELNQIIKLINKFYKRELIKE
mgnify:CR=1 FL=1